MDAEGAVAKATSVESECAALRTECASLRARLAVCEAQAQSDKDALSQASKAAAQAAVEYSALQEQVARGASERLEQEQQVDELRQALDSEILACAQIKDKLQALQDELDARSVRVEGLETELSQQKITAHKMQEKVSLAQASMQTEKKRLEEQIQEHYDQVVHSKSEVDKLSRETERLGCKVTELEALMCQRDAQLSSAQAELDQLREQQGLQRAEHEHQLQVLKDKGDALTQERDALSLQLDSTEALVQTSRQDRMQADEQVKASVRALHGPSACACAPAAGQPQANANWWRLQATEARARVEKLEAELKEVEDNVQTHLINIHKLSERAEAAEASLELATQRAVVLEAQAKSALRESIDMQTCINEEKKARKDALEELSNAKAESHATLQAQLKAIQSLESSLETMRSEMSGKEVALKEALAEITTVQSELEQKQHALDAAREESSTLHLSIASAEKRMRDGEQEHARISSALADSKDRFAVRSAEIETLQKKCNSLESCLEEREQALTVSTATIEEQEEALAALRREAVAKETAHAGVVSERDAVVAEARREAEDTAVALAKATEEAAQARASLEATTTRLHELQKEHSDALGELAGRETAMAERESQVEAALRASLSSLTQDFECKCQEVVDVQAEMAGLLREHALQMQEAKDRFDEQHALMFHRLQEQEGQSATDSLTEKHSAVLKEIEAKHAAEILVLTGRHDKSLDSLRASHASEMESKQQHFQDTIASASKQHAHQLQSLSQQRQLDRHDNAHRMDKLRQDLDRLDRDLEAAREQVYTLCSHTGCMYACATHLGSALRHDLEAFARAFRELVVILEEDVDERACAAQEDTCTAGQVTLSNTVHHQDELVAATTAVVSDLSHIRSCFSELVAAVKADSEQQGNEKYVQTRQAKAQASVMELQQGLLSAQHDLVNIVECTKLALEEDVQCRMSFELGKGMCDEVEATLDRLQHSVRLVKDEARLRKESSVLLDAGPSVNAQLSDWQDSVQELEEKLQRALDAQEEAKTSFDAHTSKLEEELAEAAELLEATGTAEDALRAELAEARSQLAGAQEREDELQRDLNEALACLKAIQDEREMGGIEMGGMLSGFATDADTHQGSGCGSDGGAVPSLRHLASDKLGQQPLEEPSEDYNGLHSGAPHPNATAVHSPMAYSSVESGVKLGQDDMEVAFNHDTEVAFNHLTVLTSLQEKVAAQHMRILQLEDEVDRARSAEPSHGLEAHARAAAPLLPNGTQHAGGDVQGPAASDLHARPPHLLCSAGACEHEDVLEDVRAELLDLCASLDTQDGLEWDEETGSDDVFDMLQVVQRALRQKHLQVEYLTESLVNAPSTGEVGTLTAQKAMLTAQLAAALDRLGQADRQLPFEGPAAAEGRRAMTDKHTCSGHPIALELPDAKLHAAEVQGRVDEMAQLLAAKEKEVGMLQMKVMAQAQVVQVMTEHQHSTAQRLHAWLLKIGTASHSSAGEPGPQSGHRSPGLVARDEGMGSEGNGTASRRDSGENGHAGGVLTDAQVRESVGTVLRERETLLTSARAKDDKIAALKLEHKALEAKMLGVQTAHLEALAQRDATIRALQFALAGVGR